jgi:hypothetical protein
MLAVPQSTWGWSGCPSKTLLKSKNPANEAVRREREEEWR